MKHLFIYRDFLYGGCELLIAKLANQLQLMFFDDVICIGETVSKEMRDTFMQRKIKFIEVVPWDELNNIITRLCDGEDINVIVFEWETFVNIFFSTSCGLRKTLFYCVHPNALVDHGYKYDFRNFLYESKWHFIKKLTSSQNIIAMDEVVRDTTRLTYKQNFPMNILRICVDIKYKQITRDIVSILSSPILMTVARADFPFKGYLLGLLRWFSDFNNLRLRLVVVTFGNDIDIFLNELNRLSDAVRQRVTVYDKLNLDELGEVLKNSTLFVGMGTSVLDAASYGIPSIPVKPYTYEVLCNGRFDSNPSFICAGDNLEYIDFSECVNSILTMTSNEYYCASAETLDLVSKNYGSDKIAKQLREHFLSLSYDANVNADFYHTWNDIQKCKLIMIKKNIDTIKKYAETRRIIVWGAGIGGKDVVNYLKQNNINVFSFVDKNHTKIKKVLDIPVFAHNVLDVVHDYVVVSLRMYNKDVIRILEQRGFALQMDYILFFCGKDD